MRERHPFKGKEKLQAMLEQEGLRRSTATVGRIVSKGLAEGRIRPASLCEGA